MTLRVIEMNKKGQKTVGVLTEDNTVHHFVKTSEQLEDSLKKSLSKVNQKGKINGQAQKSA